MPSATSSTPVSRVRASRVLAAGLTAAALAAVAWWWARPPAALLTAGQVVALMPTGSSLHSLARLDVDGGAPADVAAVVRIPPFPGARRSGYTELVARYNRWRHRLEVVFQRPLLEAVPVSVDAGRIIGGRDGAVFQSLDDDGRWSYRVVGLFNGAVAILAAGDSSQRVVLADPLVVDRGRAHALVWDGTTFVQAAVPPVAPIPSTLTWRFRMHNGAVAARTNRVTLSPRQILQVLPVGGGQTPIVIADPRLDIVENGFRTRHEGIYTIRILVSSTPIENAYVLTVVVGGHP